MSIESSQIFAGHTGTNCGTVRVRLEVEGDRAELVVAARLMGIVGSWTERFDCLVWIHADAHYDDGTELDPDEYNPPVGHFSAAVEALRWLDRPFKLSTSAGDDD